MPTTRRKKDESTPDPIELRVPVEPAIVIARSMELKRIIQILLNGAHTLQPGGRPFIAHTGFLLTMRQAYEQGNAERFVLAVERYLTEAVNHVPQAGTKEQIPEHIQALCTVIDQAGFPLVAQQLLSVMNAPL